MSNGTAAQQSNSKASTVEMAIDYIKQLQAELKETKGRLEAAEKKLDEGKEQEKPTEGEVAEGLEKEKDAEAAKETA